MATTFDNHHMDLFKGVSLRGDDTIWLGWTDGTGSHSIRTAVRTAEVVWSKIWKDCSKAELWDNETRVLGKWSKDKGPTIYLVFCAEVGQPTQFFGTTEHLEDAIPMARRAAQTAHFALAEIWETKLGSSSSTRVRTVYRKDL